MGQRILVAVTREGLDRATETSDGRWSVDSVFFEHPLRCLAADPMRTRVVFAGTQSVGVLRSDDAGRTWKSAGLQGKMITSLAVSPLVPDTVYAGTKPALLFVSRDGGENWTELSGFRRIPSRWFWFSPAEKPFRASVQGIALSPIDRNVILAGIDFGAVVRSADGGRTWSGHRRSASRDCHSIVFHPVDGMWAYEGGGTGSAVSQDGGSTWARPRTGLDRRYGWAVAAAVDDPAIWYISSSPRPANAHSPDNAQAYIFRSVHGEPWQKLAGGLPQPIDHMPYALLVDREAPGHLYAGCSNGDIWHTGDGGDHWQTLCTLHNIHRALVLVSSG